MAKRIAINGLGRIGRAVLKVGIERGVKFTAINDLTDTKTLAYLLKYDSVYGVYDKKVESGKDFIKINGNKIKVFSIKDPDRLPWYGLGVDIVVESTGLFTNRENAEKHIQAGAEKVLISAPGKNPDITIVPGVNDKKLKKQDQIISIASCTTNCLAPVAKVLNDKFKIKRGFLTTVHGYTASQNLVDGPHKKLRRGRAAAANIVLTTTGATKAVIEVIPSLKGKLNGLAMRVPVLNGSIVDFVAELGKKVSVNNINEEFKNMAFGKMKGVLDYSEDELVSSDIIGNSHSSIVDGLSTQVLSSSGIENVKGNLVKVLAWYDNEYGYSSRMVDVIGIC